MILLIDNYDSFSYNLYQMIGAIDSDIKVIRNDEMTIAQIEALKPDKIVLSPGPGRPGDAGVCKAVVQHFQGKIPILGVCLGHQAICEEYGATISYASELMHGKCSTVFLDNTCELFADMPKKTEVARYHSLIAQKNTIPIQLKIIAKTQADEVMAVKHRAYEVYGVQFHPESILTTYGSKMITNFLTGGRKDD